MARLLWTQKQNIGPMPRSGLTLAFDASRGHTVLFGGRAGSNLLGDTWEWDGESWTQMNDIGPPARTDCALAYDMARRRTVMFGGRSASGLLRDTWEWNGEDWTQVADAGPTPRRNFAMVYEATRQRVLLFGGAIEDGDAGDTWEWDGDDWVQVEDSGPVARHGHAMAFDATRRRAVLFGGAGGDTTFGDTWEWDGALWTQAAAFGPPPAVDATLVWDGRACLLFGGASDANGTAASRLFSNTWEWDGRHWTARQDMGPGPRWSHAMAFDAPRRRGVLFGGSAAAAGEPPLGDTWEQFERAARPGSPPAPGPSPAPAPGASLESVGIDRSSLREGESATLEIRLDRAASEPVTAIWVVQDGSGNTVIGPVDNPIAAGTDRVTSPVSGALPVGAYTIVVTVGTTFREARYSVVLNDQLALISLSAPAQVAQQESWNIDVQISGIAPTGFAVPARIVVQGQAEPTIFGIPVAAGTATGQLTVRGGMAAGTLAITATLGGQTREVQVEVT